MTEEDLQQLITNYHVPKHIQMHMEKVSLVCVFIGINIQKFGEQIDVVKLQQAALLHDILKICDFKTLDLDHFLLPYTQEDIEFWKNLMTKYKNIDHAEAGYEVLLETGEKEIALMIRKHSYNALIDKNLKPSTWEEKILHYADKRVCHTKIVTIEERLKEGRTRYFPNGNIPAEDAEIEKALYQLEKEICDKAQINPSDINENSVKISNRNHKPIEQ